MNTPFFTLIAHNATFFRNDVVSIHVYTSQTGVYIYDANRNKALKFHFDACLPVGEYEFIARRLMSVAYRANGSVKALRSDDTLGLFHKQYGLVEVEYMSVDTTANDRTLWCADEYSEGVYDN